MIAHSSSTPASTVHTSVAHPHLFSKLEKDTVYMPSSVAARTLGPIARPERAAPAEQPDQPEH